jgi:hypothetical protein
MFNAKDGVVEAAVTVQTGKSRYQQCVDFTTPTGLNSPAKACGRLAANKIRKL